MYQKISPQEKEEAIRLREEGRSLGFVSRRFGITRQRLYQILQQDRPDLIGYRVYRRKIVQPQAVRTDSLAKKNEPIEIQ